MRRRTLVYAAVALVVLLIELGATIGTLTGDPFAPVTGWGPTRPTDALAFVVVALGCVALAFFERFPVTVAIATTASYLTFAWRDYELGMFLPPMVVIFALVASRRSRLTALICALASLAGSLAWVTGRTGSIADAGITLLAWVAFGTVLAVFFLAPLLAGEIVRLRALLRHNAQERGPSRLWALNRAFF